MLGWGSPSLLERIRRHWSRDSANARLY